MSKILNALQQAYSKIATNLMFYLKSHFQFRNWQTYKFPWSTMDLSLESNTILEHIFPYNNQ